jgi:hypothetical protein
MAGGFNTRLHREPEFQRLSSLDLPDLRHADFPLGQLRTVSWSKTTSSSPTGASKTARHR